MGGCVAAQLIIMQLLNGPGHLTGACFGAGTGIAKFKQPASPARGERAG